jgi:hypothetical protein
LTTRCANSCHKDTSLDPADQNLTNRNEEATEYTPYNGKAYLHFLGGDVRRAGSPCQEICHRLFASPPFFQGDSEATSQSYILVGIRGDNGL